MDDATGSVPSFSFGMKLAPTLNNPKVSSSIYYCFQNYELIFIKIE